MLIVQLRTPMESMKTHEHHGTNVKQSNPIGLLLDYFTPLTLTVELPKVSELPTFP